MSDDAVVRPEVTRLVELGPMPSEDEADEDVVLRYQQAVEGLPEPANEDEVLAMLDAFPDDEGSLFGLAWTLLHYVERAPGWPYAGALDDRSPWVRRLRQRAERGGRLPER